MKFCISTGIALCLLILSINTQAQDDISKASGLASSGKFNEAIQLYSAVISSGNNITSARLGRGFAYSWKHDFSNATSDFNKVLEIEPDNMEAQKGLAYVKLWSGDYKKAIEAFNNLIAKEPNSKEFYIALGQAQMNEGLLKDARASFEKAIQLSNNDEESASLLHAIRTKPTILDLDIIGGISSAGGESNTGLRFVQLSSQVSKQLQLSAKYDNSLSLDNYGLLLRKTSFPYYAGSLLYKWNPKTMTRFEGGVRSISEAKAGELSKETQLSFEQILFFPKNKSVKAGAAFIIPNVGNTAYLLFAGYHQLVGKNVAAGLNYFYTNRNISNTYENRLLVDADFNLQKGKLINAGFYYGKSTSNNSLLSGNIYGGFLKFYQPVSNSIGVHLGISGENNFLQNLFNLNAGLRFRLEK